MKKEVYPPMHTAEHLLNQTMVRLLGVERCFSAHIEKKKSKCDYHFKRELSPEEIKKIENSINHIIISDTKVRSRLIKRDKAEKLFDLKKIPKGFDEIRIIYIGDYDAVPCIGQHVLSTKELGIFKITSSNHKDNVLRIRYKLIT